MNPAKMRAALSDPDGRFPEEAMQWARDNAAQATPILLALLTACAKAGDLSDREAVGAFYALPILSEFQEARAYPLVCALARNSDRIDDIFADFGAEFLPRLLVGIYGGDAQPLLSVAGDVSVDATVRASFLRAWCFYMLQAGVHPTAARETLGKLRDTIPADGGFLWFEWAQALIACDADFASASLRDKADMSALPPEAMAELEQDIVAWREDSVGQRDTYLIENGPIGDAIGLLAQWLEREEAPADDADADADMSTVGEAPIENRFRDVGRNDPCPCGSGMKFKKCCLAKLETEASRG